MLALMGLRAARADDGPFSLAEEGAEDCAAHFCLFLLAGVAGCAAVWRRRAQRQCRSTVTPQSAPGAQQSMRRRRQNRRSISAKALPGKALGKLAFQRSNS